MKNFIADDDAKYEVNVEVLEAIDAAMSKALRRKVSVKDCDLPRLLPVLESLYDKMYLRSVGLKTE